MISFQVFACLLLMAKVIILVLLVWDKVDTEKINAIYKNGLLQLTLPKREEAVEKPAREIKVS